VIELLRYLEDVGFEAAPRVHGTGFDDEGRETLVHVDGESPHPAPWTDEALAALGRILRELHELTAGYTTTGGAVWLPRFTRSLPRERTVIGHGDLGPWNIIARTDIPSPSSTGTGPARSTRSGTWPRPPG
jgi:Ser/Thr protein kinase RdoA (MazF antagonist)